MAHRGATCKHRGDAGKRTAGAGWERCAGPPASTDGHGRAALVGGDRGPDAPAGAEATLRWPIATKPSEVIFLKCRDGVLALSCLHEQTALHRPGDRPAGRARL